jgi:diaminohydroxyphosphoribosylaminopyrimidine deaminase/5-amino-6-(5-phosphoribosylamino)uracil reductase
MESVMMQRAIALGETSRCLSPPNPWVGCVILNGEEMVGAGATQPPGHPHAEIEALRSAGNKAKGATLIVTLEPCCHEGRTAPCTDAIIEAGIKRVVIGIQDPDPKMQGKGIAELREAGIEVDVGNCALEVSRSLEPYLHHRTTGRPFCLLKSAISIDGRTAAADGSSQWITCPEARADVHRLRDESQAIIIGSGTALADKPRLNVRDIKPLAAYPPLRVLLDRRGRVPAEGPLFDPDIAPTIVYTDDGTDPALIQEWIDAGAAVVVQKMNLEEVLKDLGQRGVIQALVEGGSSLHHSLLNAALIDAMAIYVGPKVLGSEANPMFGETALKTLQDAPTFQLTGSHHLGDTMRLDYSRKPDC